MSTNKEISKELHELPMGYPASFLPCGCCIHPRYIIVQLGGGKQRYDRIYDQHVTFCRTHSGAA